MQVHANTVPDIVYARENQSCVDADAVMQLGERKGVKACHDTIESRALDYDVGTSSSCNSLQLGLARHSMDTAGADCVQVMAFSRPVRWCFV